MQTRQVSIIGLGIKGGVVTFIALLAYFLLMRYLNLIHITELRGLNFVILSLGIAGTFYYHKSRIRQAMTYLDGFGMACMIAAISVIMFAIFIYIYFGIIDHATLEKLKTNSPMMGSYITPFTAAASVLAEGIASGLVISFCYMQYFQDRFLR